MLTGLEINTALVAERVTILKEYPFIGVMGYAAGENPFSYPELKYEKIKLFIAEAAKLVDYIILDCSSNMLNFFTPTAIEAADLTVRIITPDLRGLNYLRAHRPLLTDDKFHYDSHLTFAGLARPFHAIDEMNHLIGGFDGLLPYAKEIERCGTGGQMFKALTYCNQRYARSASIILHDFCKGLDIPVAIYGHSEFDDVELYAYAEFDSIDNKDQYRLMDMSARCGNRDGAALRYAAERLMTRPEAIKLLIIISDGQPAGENYYGTEAEADLRGIKKEYTAKGIQLFAAAIGSDKPNIQRIYGDGFLDITNLEKLPVNLGKLIIRQIKNKYVA